MLLRHANATDQGTFPDSYIALQMASTPEGDQARVFAHGTAHHMVTDGDEATMYGKGTLWGGLYTAE